MSGGSSGKKSTPKKDEPSAIPGTGPMMTQPAFMGDNQNMLAQQLAAGGFGTQPDLMAMLTQTFTPMQVLNTQPGAAPPPTTTTPPPPASNKPRWWNDKWGDYGDWEDRRPSNNTRWRPH
jgi:hypothetical protein